MLNQEEKEVLEHIISKNPGRGDLQKELRRYLDKLIEQLITQKGGENESAT